MMSHLDSAKGGNNKPPCLQSRRIPTEQVCHAYRTSGRMVIPAHLRALHTTAHCVPFAHLSFTALCPPPPFLQAGLAEAANAPREEWCAASCNIERCERCG